MIFEFFDNFRVIFKDYYAEVKVYEYSLYYPFLPQPFMLDNMFMTYYAAGIRNMLRDIQRCCCVCLCLFVCMLASSSSFFFANLTCNVSISYYIHFMIYDRNL